MARRIILIGGMPTVGKSTIANKLSEHFGLPWISSDQIREIMKSAIGPVVDSPLNGSVDMSAEDYFEKYTPQQIAQMEYEQSVATWPGIRFMINNDWTWRDGLILEGVNVLPKFVAEEQSRHSNIQAIFLTDNNIDRTKDVIFTRGLFDKADSYPDAAKEQELEWVKLFDEMIKREANEYHQPILEIEKSEEDLSKILNHLG
jgi:2-phosphoglycerate kinase